MRNTRRSSANGKTMRILVTGHKGYIGTVMVPMLLGAGHEVVGLDTDLYEECTFCAGIQVVPDLRIDLRDIERSHLEGFAAVIHLAALSNVSAIPPPKPRLIGSSAWKIYMAPFVYGKRSACEDCTCFWWTISSLPVRR